MNKSNLPKALCGHYSRANSGQRGVYEAEKKGTGRRVNENPSACFFIKDYYPRKKKNRFKIQNILI
jgi:hypothetical protein